jgi:uncharacterized membrane protein YqjE
MNQVPTWLIPGASATGPAYAAAPAYAAGPTYAANTVRPQAAPVDRPFGIAILTLVEIAVGITSLYVVWIFAYWANDRFSYDETFWGLVDAAQGLAYFACAIYGFMVAPRIWRMEPGVWPTAIRLSASLAGLAALDVLLSVVMHWDITFTDFLGIAAQACVVFYLNMTHVRRIFGRTPPASLQGAGF